MSQSLGSGDAQVISAQFENLVLPQDIITLPRYEAHMKLLVRGSTTKPFSLRSLPPPEVPHDKQRIEVARRPSRTRYAEKREKAEVGIRQ
jgi:hypothetical protein